MAVTDDLSASLKEAMKAKDKTKLNAIRQIQTEIAKKKAEKVKRLPMSWHWCYLFICQENDKSCRGVSVPW
jgi:uncharacterized membrane protein (DUF106 family)